MIPSLKFIVPALLLSLAGCGYHTVGHASRLPASLHVLAVPVFVNQTQTFRIEQMLTSEVVREFNGNKVEQTYKGTLSGDDLKLSMDNGRGRGPQEIAFKRAK